MMLHYAVRKLWLEVAAREALRDGFRQVVVLGAGFDTLALRLSGEFADVLCVEIDHPATQRVKVDALRARGGSSENLMLRPLDLASETLDTALRDTPLQHGERTLFVAEGLLMYLPPASVDRVFADCAAHGGVGSRVAFTFMERFPGGRIAFRGQSRAIDLWLRLKREPFRWGIPREELSGFLEQRGYHCLRLVTDAELRRAYLSSPDLQDEPLVDGDHLCLAQSCDPSRPPDGRAGQAGTGSTQR
jgi:methyltransferase (TIGR00027 family)